MGVPSFYRWLVNKYPNIRVKADSEAKGDDDIGSRSLNPNGMEFDNLYLDMNGIIHPCFHPDDHQSLAPTTYEDVFRCIYEYIDSIFSIVRPRKLLYMAIDGVAPRAKMNQQRSRRFRTAKDDEIAEAEEDRLRKQFEMEGKRVLQKVDCEVSDSNVITPGTEFMHRLSKKLQGYIESRLNIHPGWKQIQVILSDSNVPGEGEHKIMSFIRYQRSLPGYNSNTRHCLYGLDADLIMLALATHEVHFSILREDVLTQKELQPVFQFVSKTSSQASESHSIKSRGWFNDVKTEGGWFKDSNTATKYAPIVKRPYEFLHVWILREYIELDMKMKDVPENFEFDLERIIDDLIFMFFFAGNDFLPHMPTLKIHEGVMDLLMTVYKEHFKNIGGYLVNMEKVQDKKGGYVKLKRVEKFILLVGTFEEKIFKKRSELRERSLKRLCQNSAMQDEENEIENLDLSSNSCRNSSADKNDILRNTEELKEKLKENLRKNSDLIKDGDTDKVKLGNPGWKERYYKHKFSAETKQEIEIKRKEIVQKYTEGLLWVLQYYFQGVPSWSWFYPYHYGPFASDLKGLSQVRAKFQKGHPFKPYDQLMSVLPPRSAHALPKPYAKLITDMDSRIIGFYPTDFGIDTDGKRYAWQGVCKLPFIDEQSLLVETRRVEKELTLEETERNSEKVYHLFVSSTLGTKILSLFQRLSANEKIHMDANVSGAVGGYVRLCNHDHLTSPPDIILLLFELPEGILHIPRPLEGVIYPTKTITEDDIQKILLWHENSAGSGPTHNRPQSQATWTKANGSSKFPSTSSNAECQHNHTSGKLSLDPRFEICKVAGTGWGAGRGASGFNSSMAKGIADMRISESSHNPRFYGRGQTVTNAFRSSGNALTHNLNPTWRSSSQANTNTFLPSGNASTQNSNHLCGRSSQANTNTFWPSRNATTQNLNHSWHRSSQANTNPSSHSHGRGQPDWWTQKKW